MRWTPPNSVLLDKSVIKRYYEFLRRSVAGQVATHAQEECTTALLLLSRQGNKLYMTTETKNVLQGRSPVVVQMILSRVAPLVKGVYLRRWARRLREFGFSAEDAVMLSYGCFGSDPQHQLIGVDLIVTLDRHLVNHFHNNLAAIEQRFHAMIIQLPDPYDHLTLPQLLTTEDIIRQFGSGSI